MGIVLVIVGIILSALAVYLSFEALDTSKQRKVERRLLKAGMWLTIRLMYMLAPFNKGVKSKIVKKQKELDDIGTPHVFFISLDNDDD